MIDFVLNHFHELATLPGAVPKLRSFILDQAVRGNLTADWREEHPEVEPASALLERIREEKKELVKAGKIKKQKELPPVEPDEVPFELPESWEWVRLGSLAESVQYGYTASAVDDDSLTRFVRITDIQNGRVRWDTVPGCRINDAQRPQYSLRSGDVLVARTGGTVGKTFLVESVPRASVFASYLIRVRCLGVHPDFLIHYLRSDAYWEQLYQFSKGTGQPNVNGASLRQLYVPILDRREQSEIVHRVDELMKICDQLEAAQSRSEELRRNALASGAIHLSDDTNEIPFTSRWQSFSDRLPELVQHPADTKPVQDAILQLAVRGHLTADWRAENPDVEPASALLERIRAEKKELEKAGEIKKQKELPPVEPDEVPFEVPESWEWVRLGDIGSVVGGGTPKSSVRKYWEPGEINWVTPADMNSGEQPKIAHGRRQISREGLKSSSAKLLPAGSVLFSSRAPIGYVRIAERPVATNQGVRSVVPGSGVTSMWLYWLLLAFANSIARRGTGTTFAEISGSELARSVIPLPPRTEQVAVAGRVEGLLAVADRLRSACDTLASNAKKLLQCLQSK